MTKLHVNGFLHSFCLNYIPDRVKVFFPPDFFFAPKIRWGEQLEERFKVSNMAPEAKKRLCWWLLVFIWENTGKSK